MICLLPMKDHSSRVKDKNVRLIRGKPLFFYILNTLLEVDGIDKIAIDTDSERIKEWINKLFDTNKIDIIERPPHLIGDNVPMNSIIAYDMEKYDDNFFMQTHSTNPLLKRETIERAIDIFFEKKDKYDSLFTVTPVKKRMYWQNLIPINHNPMILLNTQDLPLIYEENSCIYIFSEESFKVNGNNRIGKKPFAMEIDKIESFDIDDEDDFLIVKTLIEADVL